MSRYSKLLTKIIAESGYTAKEVIEKCNEIGNGIDTTRLSKLQSGKLSAPSSRVSRDLARVCNADERLLVLEGYLEKAPQEIIDAFLSIKSSMVASALNIFKKNFSKDNQKYFNDVKKELEKEPLAEFIVTLIDGGVENISITENGIDMQTMKNDVKVTLSQPTTLPVKDNAMFPIIPEGSKVYLEMQEKYNNGDILAVKTKDNENIIIREILYSKNCIILVPLKKEYEVLTYNKNDVTLIGKVTDVLTSI